MQRLVFAETPVRIEYQVTEKGRALADVVSAIGTWAEAWLPLDTSDPISTPHSAAAR